MITQEIYIKGMDYITIIRIPAIIIRMLVSIIYKHRYNHMILMQ